MAAWGRAGGGGGLGGGGSRGGGERPHRSPLRDRRRGCCGNLAHPDDRSRRGDRRLLPPPSAAGRGPARHPARLFLARSDLGALILCATKNEIIIRGG